MKNPGILYRLSFLVVLNSLFIFSTVTFVSIENNQAEIDRLISYKFNFIGNFFRSALDDNYPALHENIDRSLVDSPLLDGLYANAEKCINGLVGLAVLTTRGDDGDYEIIQSVYPDPFGNIDQKILKHIRNKAHRDEILTRNILVGGTIDTDEGILKTIYIPLIPANANVVLAATISQDNIIGGNKNYYYTIITLFLAITLITLLIINLLFKDFVKPLRHLVQGMEKMTETDELCRIDEIKNDEIGRVANVFNNMSVALWEKQKQLTESNRNLTETLAQLSRANSSLEESKTFLSKIIDNSPFAIIATDTNRKIVIFSKAAISTFDIGSDEAKARNIIDFFPMSPAKLFAREDTDDEVFQTEMICCKKSGENFPALVCRVPIREISSRIVAYLFIIRDISESQGFQDMMISIDRMATRGVMAGEIAHEINNYLAIILGNVELLPLLLAKNKMDKFENKLEILKMTVAKIQRFSEGLMGYGNEEAVFELGDLNQLIENLVAFLKPQNRYDNIRFNITPSMDIPLVEIDGSQLQQLLVNLLNNAADALREKSVDRQIDITTALSESGDGVSVTITDNAGGLPDDLHKVIFRERYTGKRRGRGFGLVIVKRIIDKHGGKIEYTSQPDQGTVFNFTIPIRVKAGPPESQAESSAQLTS